MRRLALLLLASCGGARPPVEADDDRIALPTEVVCYAGNQHTGNDYMGEDEDVLLRRTVSPGFDRITEEWMFVGRPPGWTDLYTIDDAHGTATVTTTSDAADWRAPPVAQATLDGDAWHWDSWRWSRDSGGGMKDYREYVVGPTHLSGYGGSLVMNESTSSVDISVDVFDCAAWDARAVATSLPPAEVRCYAGTRATARFGHDPYDVEDIVLRRTIDPATSEIVEEWGFADGGELDVRRLVIDGDTYTVIGRDAAWAWTQGTLEGEPWRWTAWGWSRKDEQDSAFGTHRSMHYEVTADGLEGEGGTGSIEPEIVVTEHLAELACPDWEARRDGR